VEKQLSWNCQERAKRRASKSGNPTPPGQAAETFYPPCYRHCVATAPVIPRPPKVAGASKLPQGHSRGKYALMSFFRYHCHFCRTRPSRERTTPRTGWNPSLQEWPPRVDPWDKRGIKGTRTLKGCKSFPAPTRAGCRLPAVVLSLFRISALLDNRDDTVYGITMNLTPIVIDTNILVSGLRSRRGMSYRLLTFLGGRLYRPVITVPLVVEYEKSLCDPKTEVPFSPVEIGKYLNYFCSVSDCRKVHFLWRPFLRDSNDDMVLEAAVSGRCECIVTFNIADFKGIDKFGIVAITPGDVLQEKGVSL